MFMSENLKLGDEESETAQNQLYMGNIVYWIGQDIRLQYLPLVLFLVS